VFGILHIGGDFRSYKGNKMIVHIRVIRTLWPHWGKFSGINQFIRYINTNKYEIEESLALSTDDDFPLKNPEIRKILRKFVQKRAIPWYSLSDLGAEIKALQKCLVKPVDIIHYLDGEHTTQFLPYVFWSSHRRTKLIAMYHQPPDILKEVTNKDVIRRLDSVIVVSPEQIPYFKGIMEPEKIFLILHGIDTSYFKPGNRSKNDDTFRCITVGHWLRDFTAVRKVAEKLSVFKDIEFHVVSSRKTGPKEFGLEDLNNVILYKDAINDDLLLEMYQQSHALFLPMQQSTANNALLEGIACGLPVISTLLPSIQTYVSGDEALLIDKNDPEKLANSILYLYENPSERHRMSNASRKRAEELDWQRIAPLYEDVYSQTLNQ
jgi:glycosyltransferase involved in cell wall biosynthesis